MRVFITGATGFIGKAVVKELIDHGHSVLGLARSDAKAEPIKALGAEIIKGTLQDLDVLKKGAANSDGVIHLAFVFEAFADFMGACRMDREAIEAMASVMEGSNKPLLITTGTLLMKPGHPAKEDDVIDFELSPAAERGKSETLTVGLSSRGIRGIVMRLAPTNHGDGDHGFVPMMIAAARKKGASVYVGDGTNVWPTVHVLDTARAYRLVLEKPDCGPVFHPTAELVKMGDVAEAIGKGLQVPVKNVSMEEAQEVLGFLSAFVGIDNQVSNDKTRSELGWEPQQCTLLEDLKTGTYFQNKNSS